MDVDAYGKVYLGMPHVTGVFSPAPAAWGPRANPGGRDGFYGVLAADGSALLYGNYMGGSSNPNSDGGSPCVRVAPCGDVYTSFRARPPRILAAIHSVRRDLRRLTSSCVRLQRHRR